MLCAKFRWKWYSRSGEEDFKILSMYFDYHFPLEKGDPLIWMKLNSLHPSMFCAKFGWNWHSGSGEEDF